MNPILIIQLHRLGDIILTYPLFLWLKKTYPNCPIFILGEQIFYKEIKRIFLGVHFIGLDSLPWLKQQKFSLLINLSHRRESAYLARDLKAEKKIGLIVNQQDELYILGRWQLYRHSLIHNNRHNSFHWCDLNSLDVIPYTLIKDTKWTIANQNKPQKIGIFLGASTVEKTPSLDFWTDLIQNLLVRGYTPFLLGGEKERPIAKSIEQSCSLPSQANLSGKFNLKEFTKSLSYFDLLIAPDTGPMHIAVFMGKRVLNLSLGNVSAWDTGPYLPGNFVLFPYHSCYPCWECQKNFFCHFKIKVKDVLFFLENYPYTNKIGIVGRKKGLFTIKTVNSSLSLKEFFRNFWFFYFGYLFGLWGLNLVKENLKKIKEQPLLTEIWLKEIKKFIKYLTLKTWDREYWKKTHPFFRLFTSYAMLDLENANFHPKKKKEILKHLEELFELINLVS